MGYLRLEPDPADGRARIIRYTERGWRFFRAGRQISKGVGQRWAAAIGTDRYQAFVATLREIIELGDEPETDQDRKTYPAGPASAPGSASGRLQEGVRSSGS
jgi:hypothetical protein